MPDRDDALERKVADLPRSYAVQPNASEGPRTSARNATARVYLAVPFDENDVVKALGARWDPQRRSWYVPAGIGPGPFARWVRQPLTSLPGEDRTFGGSQLFVDLVPGSCWFTNVRSNVAPRDWDSLRRLVYARAAMRCEICGARLDRAAPLWSGDGRTARIDAHERWEYDPIQHVQRLRRIICLCTECHQVTHFGRTQLYGDAEAAVRHLMRVNEWGYDRAQAHIDHAFDEWEQRDAVSWVLDLSIIVDAGVSVVGRSGD